jgi:hypothetical protein
VSASLPITANTVFTHGDVSRVHAALAPTAWAPRDVELTWDGNVVVTAREIRPGIAILAEEKYCKERMNFLLKPGRYSPEAKWGNLGRDSFCAEIDQLLARIEKCESGKRLIDFFGKVCTVPDGDGKYGEPHPGLKINPRHLIAYDGLNEVNINVVILANRDYRQTAHTIAALNSLHESAASDGLGAWSTVCVWPRAVLLTDRVAMPPELILAHELIHSMHHVSGTCEPRGTAEYKDAIARARRLAGKEFQDYFNFEVARVLFQWPNRGRLSPDKRRDLTRQKYVWDELLVRATRKLVYPIPIAEIDGKLQAHGDVVYEEVRTHGNEVALEWLDGVVAGQDCLNPSPREAQSDGMVDDWFGELLRATGRQPTPQAVKELNRVVVTKYWRLKARGITEMRIARELAIATRLAYSPTTRRTPCMIATGVPRSALCDTVFSGEDSVKALHDEVGKVDPTPTGQHYALPRIKAFLAQGLCTSEAQREEVVQDSQDPGWGQWVCETLQESTEYRVDLSEIPGDLLGPQKDLIRDAVAHPDKHRMAPSRESTDVLYRQGWVPPPVPVS